MTHDSLEDQPTQMRQELCFSGSRVPIASTDTMPPQKLMGGHGNAQVKELGLWKPSGFPRPSDDFVALIEALPPPKAEALAWLEGASMPLVLVATHRDSAVDGLNVQLSGDADRWIPRKLQ
jgi:hypothetical protein